MRKYHVTFVRAWQQHSATNAFGGMLQSCEQRNLRGEEEECGVTEMPLTLTTAAMPESSFVLEVKV